MSKINNFLNNSNIQKQPSKKDQEKLTQSYLKKRKEEEAELIKKMNIPPRDESKYPMPQENEIKEAGLFIYTLGTLADSYDKNLQALVLKYFITLKNALDVKSTHEDLLSVMVALTDLKCYLVESNNPLFTSGNKNETSNEENISLNRNS